MSIMPRDWLPGSAFDPPRTLAALDACAAAWAQHWMGVPDCTLGAVRSEAFRPGAATAGRMLVSRPMLNATLGARQKRVLVEALLALSLEGQALTSHDHILIDQFAEAVIEDLLDRLETLLAPKDVSTDEAGTLVATLSLRGEEIARLRLPETPLIALVKAAIPPSRMSTPLTARRTLVAQSRITLEMVLGRARLAVSDVSALGVGDTLILDQSIGASIALREQTSGQIVGHGQLETNQGRMSVQL